MTQAFDTLGYARRLREAGVDPRQAEAHADAAREFLTADLVTKSEFGAGVDQLDTTIEKLDAKIDRVETTLGARIDRIETTLGARIDKLDARIEQQTLALTVRLGGSLVVALTAFAAIFRLH